MTNNYLSLLLIAGMIAIYIWMLHQSHKLSKPDDGGRHKYLYPPPPEDMLYDIPPIGSVVFGSYKGKYICKCVNVEGAILVSGGSGSGKSTTIVELYLMNCNKKARCAYEKNKKKTKRKFF